jgi:hypothetical protein
MSRSRLRRLSITLPLFAAAAALAVVAVAWQGGTREAAAIAPCVPHNNTSEELEFLGLLQTWRNQNVPNSEQLLLSESLNAAAYGYARFLADNIGLDGHTADGANWSQRALACGYEVHAGGEGLAVVEGSTQVNVTAQQALAIMASHGGSGIYVPSIGDPYRCVGIGKAVSASGQRYKVVWVTLVMFTATGQPCADAITSPQASDPAPSPSASPSATPSPTPTPTPTATPAARFNASLDLVPGQWNLVTLPAGPIAEVLARAGGCYDAVYQMQGGEWRRYSPNVPGYANNLATSNGGGFWIKASAKNCGRIDL